MAAVVTTAVTTGPAGEVPGIIVRPGETDVVIRGVVARIRTFATIGVSVLPSNRIVVLHAVRITHSPDLIGARRIRPCNIDMGPVENGELTVSECHPAGN